MCITMEGLFQRLMGVVDIPNNTPGCYLPSPPGPRRGLRNQASQTTIGPWIKKDESHDAGPMAC